MSRAIPHPSVKPKCTVCFGQSYVVKPKGEWAEASLCPCVGSCEECDNTGFSRVSSDFLSARRRCICTSIKRRIQTFNHALVPARHANSTRQRFRPASHTFKAFGAASHFVQDFNPGGENFGLIFYGPVGTGKTHLMAAILRDIVFQTGVSARFVEFSHLLSDLRGSFERRGAAREATASELVEPLVNVDVLAIDELGKGKNTDWERDVLDELISRRYNAAKTILATTNYKPIATGVQRPDLTALSLGSNKALPGLSDRVGPRVFSRLQQMADFTPVDGPDYRLKTPT